MILVILGGIPLYLPPGTTGPLVLGIPSWMALSVAFTLLFAAFTSWLCLRWWNLAEPEEEGRAAGAAGGDGPAVTAAGPDTADRSTEGGAPWTT
jgi:hypothetical protein